MVTEIHENQKKFMERHEKIITEMQFITEMQ